MSDGDEEYYFDDGVAGGDGEEFEFQDSDGPGAWGRTTSDMFARPAQKARPVVLTPSGVLGEIESQVDNVVEVLAWSRTSALLMLRHCKWSSDIVKERYFDDPERLMAEAKVTDLDDKFAVSDVSVTCSMCWDDVVGGKAAHLACGHPFCVECWADHLRHKLKTASTGAIAVSCPQDACPQYCGQQSFERVFGRPSKELDKYIDFVVRSFVEGGERFRNCPAPGCNFISKYPVARSAISDPSAPVTCDCGYIYCFACGFEEHSPASCKTMASWRKKESDESETANWVAANTKPCPGKNCGRVTEKNGGCNHMTCPQCRHEWCWICEGPWSKHGSSWYKCNYFDDKADTGKERDRDAARTELERYIFYYSRFQNHGRSRKLDRQMIERTQNRIEQKLASSTQTVIDLDYLNKTAQVVTQCRHVLQYTYAYAFYLPKGGAKELFEYNQSQLEYWTEQLSHFIEDTSDAYDKQQVVNFTSTAEKMLQKLQEGTIQM